MRMFHRIAQEIVLSMMNVATYKDEDDENCVIYQNDIVHAAEAAAENIMEMVEQEAERQRDLEMDIEPMPF